jgi:hypothetical protein
MLAAGRGWHGLGQVLCWRGNFFAISLFLNQHLCSGPGLRTGLHKPAVLRQSRPSRLWRQSLSRRMIALAAAYAIALSGLIASFGATQVAAEAIAQPGGILCHGGAWNHPATSPDGTNGKICVDDCCVGCLAMTAALPLPPAVVVAVPQFVNERVGNLTSFTLVGGADWHDHRSRAPPTAA